MQATTAQSEAGWDVGRLEYLTSFYVLRSWARQSDDRGELKTSHYS